MLPSLSFAQNQVDKKSEVSAKIAAVDAAESACLDNPDNQNTIAMKECSGAAFDGYDKILNDEYKIIVNNLKKPTNDQYQKADNAEILKRLVTSQRAWVKFRDSNSDFTSTQMLGGTGEGLIYIGQMNSMTKARILEIIDTIYGSN